MKRMAKKKKVNLRWLKNKRGRRVGLILSR